ncbi:hypothetical protein ASG82_22795 [Mycobacterium sp. Soil538]|nr:hypothetical protein ASG82_22795 [Mycobacterium sp. Soil538]
MSAVLVLVVALAIVAAMVAVMWRIDRANRRLLDRRREAWKAAGSVGPAPGEYMGSGDGGYGGGAI